MRSEGFFLTKMTNVTIKELLRTIGMNDSLEIYHVGRANREIISSYIRINK